MQSMLLWNAWKVGEVGMTSIEWIEDFKSYINELDILKDDYNGIMEYIDDGYALLTAQEDQIEQLEHDLAVTQNNLNYYMNGND